MNVVEKRFNQAVNHYRAQRYSLALDSLNEIPLRVVSLQIFMLRATCLKKLGDIQTSLHTLQQASNYFPDDHELLNSLANTYRQVGDLQQATQLYEKLLANNANYYLANYNFAILLKETGRSDKALDYAEAATSIKPEAFKAALLKAQCLADTRSPESKECYERVLKKFPQELAGYLSYSVYLREIGQAEQAKALLLKAENNFGALSSIDLEKGYCASSKNDFGNAREHFEKAVTNYHPTAETLDKVTRWFWLTDQPNPFSLYEHVIKQQPNNVSWYNQLAFKLIKSEQLEAAKVCLSKATDRGIADVHSVTMLGMVYREMGDLTAGLDLHRKAQREHSLNNELNKELAASLMVCGEYEQAVSILEELAGRQPFNKAWWAYLTTAYRLAERFDDYCELCNYDKFVHKYSITAPNGFDSVDIFNNSLGARLLAMHEKEKRHPLDQSMRRGTQTQGKLFELDILEIQKLKQQIELCVREYANGLNYLTNHPLCYEDRSLKNIRFSGSWSVRLTEAGFHLNHYHSEGWVSSAYYVRLPDCLDIQGQGWIKFGQPEISRHLNLEADFMIKPSEGSLVLFPSYMWHGTVPIASDVERITVAFDVQV